MQAITKAVASLRLAAAFSFLEKRMPRFLRALAVAVMACSSPAPVQSSFAQDVLPITYPDTRRDGTVEKQFGESIADPYRWLESDVRNDAEVADWVARQNAVSQAYLSRLRQRAWFAGRIRAMLDYERFGLPEKAGGRYFYTRNSGLQNQAQLFVRQGLRGKPRLLLDPNSWAKDAATALDAWKPSDDGRFLLYSVQDGGSDWRILRVLDVATGAVRKDEVRWAKFTDLAWVGSEGFLYSRFPEPKQGEAFQALNYNQAVWFHRLGTDQSEDQMVYATPDHPERSHTAQVTQDGRLAIISSQTGTDARYELHVIDLAHRGPGQWKAQSLVAGFEHDWRLVDGIGQSLWFVTNKDAPRFRLVAIDLAQRMPEWRELVAQSAETLERGSIVGN